MLFKRMLSTAVDPIPTFPTGNHVVATLESAGIEHSIHRMWRTVNVLASLVSDVTNRWQKGWHIEAQTGQLIVIAL